MGATRSIIIVAIAAICALGAALLVGKLFARPAPAAPVAVAPVKPMAQVLVARHDLQVGSAIASGDIGWQAWPADAVNPAFITDGHAPQAAPKGAPAAVAASVTRVATNAVVRGPMDALYGAIVREAILANEPITNGKLVRGGQGGFMAVVLHPGMQAIAVPVKTETAAGGFILPGDRVDVLQSYKPDATAGASTGLVRNGQITQVLLRNAQVLAIDQTAKPAKGMTSMVGVTATLEVPTADAFVLVRAKAMGEIVLALRSYADTAGPTIGTQSGGGGGVGGVVRIYRDGKPTEVTVAP
jgi:pilus assembly protein CpaB